MSLRHWKGNLSLLLLCGLSVCAVGSPAQCEQTKSPKPRPNLVLILADDLGFSDLGCYGGEIQTPHLDELAQSGIRFSQFYNTARCWPSRAAILTGYYAQQVRRDKLPGLGGGGGGTRPEWARLLPDFLHPAGYQCYHSGKWHIDGPVLAAGFDRSYSLNDHGRHFHPQRHTLDDVALPAVAPGGDYYSSTAIADYAIQFLQEHQQQQKAAPFFLYVAFTAPHFPLQAPEEDIARYAGHYDLGWDRLRRNRLRRMQEQGLPFSRLSDLEPQIGPPYDFPEAIEAFGPGEINRPVPWEQLTAAQKRFQADKMEVHAAMVDRLDQEVGRVLEQLDEMGATENTLVLFLSDNGASAEIMIRDDGHNPDAAPGSAASHLCLGPGFSSAANTPFRRHKTWVHEGGISTPLIVRWPKEIAANNEIRNAPGHVIDIVPTLLDAAQAEKPDHWEGMAIPPAPGQSLRPLLNEDSPDDTRQLWWLHEGNRAYRDGSWKIVSARGEPWELYHFPEDRIESNDLAAEQPDRVAAMQDKWNGLLQTFTEQLRNE